MMAHETFGFWIFFAVFPNSERLAPLEPKVTVVKLSTPTSSDESFAAWIVDPWTVFKERFLWGKKGIETWINDE